MLHYTRTYEIKGIIVPTEKLAEVRGFFHQIAADEKSGAVLRKATPQPTRVQVKPLKTVRTTRPCFALAPVRRRVGEREPDLKAGFAGLGHHLDAAAVLLHDALDGVQAEAGTLADALGGEERFRKCGFWTSSGIPGPLSMISTTACNGHREVRSNLKLAFATHGVNGVIDDVGPNLIQLAAK